MAGVETPATRVLRAAGVAFTLHEYAHDPATQAYGSEAATALGVPAERVFKTLVVSRAQTPAVCVIPVGAMLALRSLGKHVGLATPAEAERWTGYVLGGISPLGQRRRLDTLLDASAMGLPSVFVSAGRRGLEIELAPDDLVALSAATVRELT